jgi:hypothetical protein
MSWPQIVVSEHVPPGEIWVERCIATRQGPLRIEPPETVEIRCELTAGHARMHEAQVPNPLGPEWTNW